MVGVVMVTVGAVTSGGVYVTVKTSVAGLPAASRAVTVRTLSPDCRAMLAVDQAVVPVAVPDAAPIVGPGDLRDADVVAGGAAEGHGRRGHGERRVRGRRRDPVRSATVTSGGAAPPTDTAMSLWISVAVSARL